MKSKRELIRIVRSPEGDVFIDLIGKKAGRGAYICPSENCLTKALKSKALERALQIPIRAEIIADLKEKVNHGEN
jgi:predicted RNA-binding protein YlxR (DUF448 family)